MNDLNELFKNFTLLKTIPFHSLSENRNAGNSIKKTVYNQGEIIHFDGDICTYIDIIISGKVVVERIDDSGNLMTITEFYPDDVLGGNLIFSKNPHYPMMVSAKTDVSLISLSKGLVFEFCATNTDFLKVYLEYISDHATLLGDKIKHYVNRSIRESLIAFLKNEYKLQKSSTIQLNTSKKAIADRIGVQRTSLSRELQKMKKEGLLIFDKDSITIINMDMLM
ncbi:Crp/Fnr family transcriptional regulator [Clostridiales bacterium BAD-6]|jgi:CRP-like cAMP-binding protein|uniref:Crp/Fnr family transcriptional regulator n=2 Tax=Sinanaerobacter chloroacetimidivorans TaxID=2818044 RepID=A0A8J7W1V0_9FIRM|nr:Crp/Fnr family transcriptional regulator [Sinanaerobacter chloroacetimidivorans]